MFRFFTLAALMSTSLLAQSEAKPPTVHTIIAGPAATKHLSDEIREADRKLFAAIFNDCDSKALSTMLADDFEFYHDKSGQTAASAKQFVSSIASMCDRQRQGIDYPANRELVDASLLVYPLNNYGAIQIGEHRFFEKKEKGENGRLLEFAKFTHLWKKTREGWRLAEVLSYDHRAANTSTTP